MTICQLQLPPTLPTQLWQKNYDKVVIFEAPTHLQVTTTFDKIKLGLNGFIFKVFNRQANN